MEVRVMALQFMTSGVTRVRFGLMVIVAVIPV